ncbi:MAG: hypothetical protein H6P98_2492, partial [Candidatus Aminicenantes bacterium]|nr:hypothetical protein [Candidatus Aminicenantes bacterium]
HAKDCSIVRSVQRITTYPLRFKKNGDEICIVEGEWLTLPVRDGRGGLA